MWLKWKMMFLWNVKNKWEIWVIHPKKLCFYWWGFKNDGLVKKMKEIVSEVWMWTHDPETELWSHLRIQRIWFNKIIINTGLCRVFVVSLGFQGFFLWWIFTLQIRKQINFDGYTASLNHVNWLNDEYCSDLWEREEWNKVLLLFLEQFMSVHIYHISLLRCFI